MSVIIIFLILFSIYFLVLDLSDIIIFFYKEKPTLSILVISIISILMLVYILRMLNIFTETLSMI